MLSIHHSCVSNTVWLHPDINEMLGETSIWELYKDAAYCFEQILTT